MTGYTLRQLISLVAGYIQIDKITVRNIEDDTSTTILLNQDNQTLLENHFQLDKEYNRKEKVESEGRFRNMIAAAVIDVSSTDFEDLPKKASEIQNEPGYISLRDFRVALIKERLRIGQ
jgi:hypothetical protein